jgi:CRP/FNR family transcriptional regulator, anaerobic regulatory protein
MNPVEILLQEVESQKLFEKTIILSRNEFLKHSGTIDTNAYFIESGSLKISVFNENEERIIRFGYQNDFIVALDSFFTENPSDFSIQILKKTTVKVLRKKDFYALIQSKSKLSGLWQKILEHLIIQQIEREKDLLTTSPKERYERVLRRSPQLFQEIPNKHIANYLRMTPETLSRLKKS